MGALVDVDAKDGVSSTPELSCDSASPREDVKDDFGLWSPAPLVSFAKISTEEFSNKSADLRCSCNLGSDSFCRTLLIKPLLWYLRNAAKLSL